MKLVDILARELADWPHSGDAVGQSSDNTLHLNERADHRGQLFGWTEEKFTQAEYCNTAWVTRAEWQAAVEALKAEKAAELRPTERAVEWDGVGLPPVGAEIEALLQGIGSTTYFWQRAKVVHVALPESGGEILVFSLETTRPAWVDEFRPIRTQEQIATEEREKAITDIAVIMGKDPDRPSIRERAAIIYDAGYRKQVEK